nr:substrate-binding domain-containing protein [Streptomyces phyllanthi]
MAVSLAAGCGGDGGEGGGGMTVGLLLPSRALPRWEGADKPMIEKKVKELCPDCTLAYANAQNNAESQRQQMNSLITKGAGVIILDAADPKTLRSSVQAARQADIPVVAYDRLVEGPISGYVSFDNVQVGRLQGEALLQAMGDKADGGRVVMLNGDPASPNAAQYEEGARAVLDDKVRIERSYQTPGYRSENGYTNMSAAIAALGPNGIDGVLSASDGITTGAVQALKSSRVSPLPPITGQDADLDAVRRLITGEQTMTVYKSFQKQTDAAAAMAVALGRGNDIDAIVTTTIDSRTHDDIPAVLLTPIAVTAGNIEQTLVKDGMYTVNQICTPELRSACARAGLTP